MRRHWLVRGAALLVLAGLSVPGCTRQSGPDPVGSVDLQRRLADMLVASGTPATWVSCPKSLPAQVGGTARCDVTFGDDNSVTALLTTTQVEGDKIGWEITEADFSKDQITKRVAAMTTGQSPECDSGLNGRVGNWVHCHVARNGVTINQTVEVKEVKGLAVKLALTQLLPEEQVQDMVLTKVTPLYGRRPDRAVCDGDLPGSAGSHLVCVVTTGGDRDKYTVTATGVADGLIDFEVEKITKPPRDASGR